MTWRESVEKAITRLTTRNETPVFTRKQIVESELDKIVEEAGSSGETPEQTLSRELQKLRDEGKIAFESAGIYRLLPSSPNQVPAGQKTLFDIAPFEISANPHNPRMVFPQEELDELKGSIQKVGILVPLTIYKNTKSYPKTPYVLLDGDAPCPTGALAMAQIWGRQHAVPPDWAATKTGRNSRGLGDNI